MSKFLKLSVLASSVLVSVALAAPKQHHYKNPLHNKTHFCGKHVQPIKAALIGSSFAAYVKHHHINSTKPGFWVGGFGQITAAYNSNYLLAKDIDMSWTRGPTAVPASTFTASLTHMNLMFGYNAHHLGFFTDADYNYAPRYTTTTNIDMVPSALEIKEAYATYQFGHNFGVKAGQFISDFGEFDPINPMRQFVEATDYSFAQVKGVEGVFANNQFRASVAFDTNQTPSSKETNLAKLDSVVLHGEYQFAVAGGKAAISASYQNHTTLNDGAFDVQLGKASWTAGVHYTNNKIEDDVTVLNIRTDKDSPWLYSANINYALNHRMTVGGYGDYAKNLRDTDWTIGGKYGYMLNRHTVANAYLQYQKLKTVSAKDNVTALVAVTVKL